MRVYLRAAIVQYMASGPVSTPHILTPRPANQIPRAPDARSQIIPAVPVLPVKKYLGYGSKKRTATKSSHHSNGCAATCGKGLKERSSQGESRQTTVPSPRKGAPVTQAFT
ncbi:EKA-like protein [Blumeria hordei DH14]|uniref:EKA-like protein n=1 Tax=Blumeria graminis f. sp. hordei (strain DH14) TaxID=546991 RepID=N1J5U0_BLUG1|nr:EKA-like protein [Blumeria hordei DH14]